MSATVLQRFQDYSSTPAEETVSMLLGAALDADWRTGLIARGYGWHTDIGAFSTPIQGGGAGTILDQDQPEGSILVPSNYCLIPLSIRVYCQVPLVNAASDESEILIAVDRLSAGDSAGTYTTETPTNMRTDTASGCPLTVRSAVTGDITNPTLGVELGHAVLVADVQNTPTNTLWSNLNLIYEPKTPPLIIGPAQLLIYWGGTVATTGFANLDFLVIASSLVDELS